jgi:hypothetical protein
MIGVATHTVGPMRSSSRLLGALVLLVGLGALAIAQTGFGQRSMRSAGLTAATPGFTALAFAQPSQLPKALRRPAAAVPVTFTVANHEGRARTYEWSVLVGVASSSSVARSGRIAVPAGAVRTVQAQLRVACHGSRQRVQVTLAGTNDVITDWLTCAAGAR